MGIRLTGGPEGFQKNSFPTTPRVSPPARPSPLEQTEAEWKGKAETFFLLALLLLGNAGTI